MPDVRERTCIIDYARSPTGTRPVRFWETRPFKVAVIAVELLVVAGIALPFFVGVSDKDQRTLRCQANLRVIWQALFDYARANNGSFPPTLSDAMSRLAPAYKSSQSPPERHLHCLELLRSGAGPTTAGWLGPDEIDGGSLSYAYLGRGLTTRAAPRTVLAHERAPNHRKGTVLNVLYLDGSVEVLDANAAAKVTAELQLGHNPPRREELK